MKLVSSMLSPPRHPEARAQRASKDEQPRCESRAVALRGPLTRAPQDDGERDCLAETRACEQPLDVARPEQVICPTGGDYQLLSTPASKNISIYRISDLTHDPVIPPRLTEGRIAVVTTCEAGRGGRESAVRRAAPTRTAKWCGPGAPKLWRQVLRRMSARRRWQTRGFTEESAYKP